jgi:DNA-binding transcriptional regulator YhcF (GntR family)
MQLLSQRKYAKTIGVSYTTVNKAIAAGQIRKGYDKKSKKIKVWVANEEWGNEMREKHKHKLPEFVLKALHTPPLIITMTNYLNARQSLLKAIEQDYEAIDLKNGF